MASTWGRGGDPNRANVAGPVMGPLTRTSRSHQLLAAAHDVGRPISR